ncbi:hypothetical protein Pint_18722 [Pistacia integerrima]|uniref:Uncharacterized protein n=1 Tax=Pistacia integerrima TaxID=434235 RepID=A0ACC0YVS4_9ROSI|nr:hypothetical protein Pint_18722 [Pistacia integerrima]
MCASDHFIVPTVADLLQQAEGAEAMPLWVPQGPESEAICELSQC